MIERFISGMRNLNKKFRTWLTHRPILYALIGAIGIVLVWKGVEETASYFPALFGPVSLILGVAILVVAGLLVPFFAGDTILIPDVEHQERLVEKVVGEEKTEESVLPEILSELETIQEDIEELKQTIPN